MTTQTHDLQPRRGVGDTLTTLWRYLQVASVCAGELHDERIAKLERTVITRRGYLANSNDAPYERISQ